MEDFIYINNLAYVVPTEDGFQVRCEANLMLEESAVELADKVDACIKEWFEQGMKDDAIREREEYWWKVKEKLDNIRVYNEPHPGASG